MTAAVYDLPTAIAGDSFPSITITIETQDETTLENYPDDLSNYQNIVFNIRCAPGASPSVFATLGNGIEFLTDGSDGNIVISGFNFPAEGGNYSYDLKITDANGFIETYLIGSLILQEV